MAARTGSFAAVVGTANRGTFGVLIGAATRLATATTAWAFAFLGPDNLLLFYVFTFWKMSGDRLRRYEQSGAANNRINLSERINEVFSIVFGHERKGKWIKGYTADSMGLTIRRQIWLQITILSKIDSLSL